MNYKFFRVLALLLCAAGLFVFVGCAAGEAERDIPEDPPAFLEEYDSSDCYVRADGALKPISLGDAQFAAMEFVDGAYSLKYRVYLPQGYGGSERRYPLLLFLHGAGERGDNNTAPLTSYAGFRALFEGDSPVNDSIVIVPQCPEGEQWVNVSTWAQCIYSTEEIGESASLSAVLRLLNYYDGHFRVDRQRLYLMGLSMGGYATWDLLVRHGDVFAAAVPICGGCDVSRASSLQGKPIHAFHGSADPVVPPDGSRAMAQALGEGMLYTEYAGADHFVWDRAMQEEGLMQWLYSQKNGG